MAAALATSPRAVASCHLGQVVQAAMSGELAWSGDVDLARRIKEGEDGALERLVRASHARLARLAGRFFRRSDLIDDVVQETFVRAYRSIHRYRGEAPLEHWLTRIALNVCYDHLRQRRRRGEEPLPAAFTGRGDGWGWPSTEQRGPAHDPWSTEEARIAAEQALAQLGPAERLVLTLMVLEERSVHEVAALTGWSVANVKVRAFRARRHLRLLLAAPGGCESTEVAP